MKRPGSNPSTGNSRPFPSYQSAGTTPGYQPPVHYAADQTAVLEDTAKTYYQADETAGNVLAKMTAQRQQLTSAADNVWEMRHATDTAKRELQELQQKYRQKKQRLYMMIAGLAITDLLLFFRILQCRGNFFC